MTTERFHQIANRYPRLRVAVVGDFFLDRYLHIDSARAEISIETGLPVHNVVEVRSQPGAAGTIVNNLVALGIGEIHAIGFCGDDGEGYELRRALAAQNGVSLEHFITTPHRRTPVYCKPLLIENGRPPHELNRLDTKNWTPTPESIQRLLASHVAEVAKTVDVLLVLDQVELPETGVATRRVCEAAHAALKSQGQNEHKLVVLADSRRGLHQFPPLGFKMNAAELGRMTNSMATDAAAVKNCAADLAHNTGQPVFVTLAERGIIGAARAMSRTCECAPGSRTDRHRRGRRRGHGQPRRRARGGSQRIRSHGARHGRRIARDPSTGHNRHRLRATNPQCPFSRRDLIHLNA